MSADCANSAKYMIRDKALRSESATTVSPYRCLPSECLLPARGLDISPVRPQRRLPSAHSPRPIQSHPLDPEAFIQRSSTIGRKENRPSFFASNPPIVLVLELVLGKPGALISPELPSGNVQTAGPSGPERPVLLRFHWFVMVVMLPSSFFNLTVNFSL